MRKFVAIDTETTGLSAQQDRIIEFAAVDFTGAFTRSPGKKLETSYFRTLINPGVSVPPAASRVNGITDDDLKDEQSFEKAADEIVSFLEGATLIGHNIRFDMDFLKTEFGRLGIPFDYPSICTLEVTRHYLPDLNSYKLDELNRKYSFHNGLAHSALDDALTAGKLLFHTYSALDDKDEIEGFIRTGVGRDHSRLKGGRPPRRRAEIALTLNLDEDEVQVVGPEKIHRDRPLTAHPVTPEPRVSVRPVLRAEPVALDETSSKKRGEVKSGPAKRFLLVILKTLLCLVLATVAVALVQKYVLPRL